MALFCPFAATERILMAMVFAGADRQEAHEWLRQNSLRAWEHVRKGEPNPLGQFLIEDGRIRDFLTAAQISDLMDVSTHTGTAAARASALASEVRNTLAYP